MDAEPPEQPPEGRLIAVAAKASGRSIRTLAANAGISDTRWRHIVKGWQPVQGGYALVRAPATTLARMAFALELDASQLLEAGRDDAVPELRRMQRLQQNALIHGLRPPPMSDEIDLIYASKMEPREKLLRIRQVLELRAQIEAEEAAQVEADASETSVDPVHNH